MRISPNNELTICSGILTKSIIALNVIKLQKSFPKLTDGFYDVFITRIRELNFSADRLTAAVNFVIDTYQFPQPAVALFTSFDITVKLFTYQQAAQYQYENQSTPNCILPVRIPGRNKPLFAKFEDIETYNLIPWKLLNFYYSLKYINYGN